MYLTSSYTMSARVTGYLSVIRYTCSTQDDRLSKGLATRLGMGLSINTLRYSILKGVNASSTIGTCALRVNGGLLNNSIYLFDPALCNGTPILSIDTCYSFVTMFDCHLLRGNSINCDHDSWGGSTYAYKGMNIGYYRVPSASTSFHGKCRLSGLLSHFGIKDITITNTLWVCSVGVYNTYHLRILYCLNEIITMSYRLIVIALV